LLRSADDPLVDRIALPSRLARFRGPYLRQRLQRRRDPIVVRESLEGL
jgi:hypothetical protein